MSIKLINAAVAAEQQIFGMSVFLPTIDQYWLGISIWIHTNFI